MRTVCGWAANDGSPFAASNYKQQIKEHDYTVHDIKDSFSNTGFS